MNDKRPDLIKFKQKLFKLFLLVFKFFDESFISIYNNNIINSKRLVSADCRICKLNT